MDSSQAQKPFYHGQEMQSRPRGHLAFLNGKMKAQAKQTLPLTKQQSSCSPLDLLCLGFCIFEELEPQ